MLAKWYLCFLICYVCHSFSFKEQVSFISWLQSPSTVIFEPKKIKSVTVSIVSPSICHQKKMIPFKTLLLTDNAPGHPSALVEMFNEINVFSCFITQQPLCRPWSKKSLWFFKSYYLRMHFHKAIIVTTDSDSSDGTGHIQLKSLWKRSTILDTIKSIHNSQKEVKLSTLSRVWEKLIPILRDSFRDSRLQWRK